MTEPLANMAASVHQRLKNHAKSGGHEFNDLLHHFALERFIYRLSQSQYAGQFVLKGALLLRVWRLSSTRTTRDIDLLGRTGNAAEAITAIVQDVCRVAVTDDGLAFDPDSVRTAAITDDAEYAGLRVTFRGTLGNARIAMQIDIGFGDRITPEPQEIEYPSVLDMPTARILAYPPETSIAEKFHVMLQRGVLNSRMKDFFDLWALSEARAFEGPLLARAIRTTCRQRGTPVDPAPTAFTAKSTGDPSKRAQWAAFRRRLRDTDAPETFEEVATIVAGFLGPVAKAVADGDPFDRHWPPGGPWLSEVTVDER